MSNHTAHSKSDKCDITQTNQDHLESVAILASSFASRFRTIDIKYECYYFGLLHDLGKYGDLFAKRLQGLIGGLDHWSAGAELALKLKYVDVALAIQGHHIGLQSNNIESLKSIKLSTLSKKHPLELQLTEESLDTLIEAYLEDGFTLPPENPKYFPGYNNIRSMMRTRMIGSCGVDADFLDTESHFTREGMEKNYRKPGLLLDPTRDLKILEKYMDALKSNSKPELKKMRDELFEVCKKAGINSSYIRTLTAPTGLGKTLSMIVYALEQAKYNNLERIIIVLPFLSIIDQTVKVLRSIFKDLPFDYILEHHSLSTFFQKSNDPENSRLKLLSENWDAPIIVTTDVQFFESIFHNKPSSIRKVHNIINSVILFDEVQKISLKNVCQTLASLSVLYKDYDCSILFSTATQPAFNHLDREIKKFSDSIGWQSEEIVPDKCDFFKRISKLRNIRITYSDYMKIPWYNIASKISSMEECLCIVNTRRHCRNLYNLIKNINPDCNVLHLSTDMCPEHRRHIVNKVNDIQKNGLQCILVSTQCVEAGIDIDFKYVYRAAAPFDSLAQAAGRCNRNCLFDTGYLNIFYPEFDNEEFYDEKMQIPPGYLEPLSITNLLLKVNNGFLDIYDQELFQQYYLKLYDIAKPALKNPNLTKSIHHGQFKEAKENYHVIEEAKTLDILVPYNIQVYEELKEHAFKYGINNKWIRRARPYTISIFSSCKSIPSCLIPIMKKEKTLWYVCNDPKQYSEELGALFTV